MNVPMYLRDEERELDRVLEEKEERWRREGLMGQQTSQQTALEIEARRQQAMRPDDYIKMQKLMMEQAQNTYITNNTNGLLGAIGGSPHNGPPYANIFSAKPQVMHPDPNTMPELQMPLDVAYNMWLVRFGDTWVKSEDVQDADGFRWPLVASRLRDMRLMEVTTVSNHHRLVPHVWT